MRLLFLLLVGVIPYTLLAKGEDPYNPKVPTTMEFAGLRLKITDGAQKEIQKDVDMLTKSPKYFELKADRARLYFPIIEKVFKEEGVPDDFKYLSVQESALISDAVSSSNAVGFWQFKDFTGKEVGLRIDRNVDERLNIVSSTHGAAKYFKRHNFYFDNWIYTLLAHMTGRGGAAKYVDSNQFGATKMTINRSTHWYVKRCIAHKIAFEYAMKQKHSQGMRLVEYTRGANKSLRQVADEMKVAEEDVKTYNKWLKSGKIPDEKTYVVIVPVKGNMNGIHKIEEGIANRFNKVKESSKNKSKPNSNTSKSGDNTSRRIFPKFGDELNTNGTVYIKINGIRAILAKKGESVNSISEKVQLHPKLFARYNDLNFDSPIREGEIYYLRPKRSKGLSYYYTVQSGETLWGISQKFGIRKRSLARLNRMGTTDRLETGRLLWLKQKRPKDVPIEIRPVASPPVDETISVKELIKDVKSNLRDDENTQDSIARSIRHQERLEKEQRAKNERAADSLEKEREVVESTPKQKPLDNIKKQTNGMVSTHQVVAGETLYGISKAYGVSVQDLVEWNDLYNSSLAIGQKLFIHGNGEPEEEVATSTVDFHVVQPGDTFYGISKQYGIEVIELLRINQKENFELAIGERLRVKE